MNLGGICFRLIIREGTFYVDGLMLLKPGAFAPRLEREAYSSGCQSSSVPD